MIVTVLAVRLAEMGTVSSRFWAGMRFSLLITGGFAAAGLALTGDGWLATLLLPLAYQCGRDVERNDHRARVVHLHPNDIARSIRRSHVLAQQLERTRKFRASTGATTCQAGEVPPSDDAA